MEYSQTFSLTQLAEQTGKGKAGFRDMIETGRLVATREESGRRDWIVKLEDALAANFAANLRFPADSYQPPGTYMRCSSPASENADLRRPHFGGVAPI